MPEHMLVSNASNNIDNRVCRERLLHCYHHINGLGYENEIWLKHTGIDAQYYNNGEAHTSYLDGYDTYNKTVCKFYGDYWHANPQELCEHILISVIRQWREKLLLKAMALQSSRCGSITGN